MIFKKTTVPFEKTGLFSDLILDFINHSQDVKPFLDEFSNLESIQKKLQNIDSNNRVHLVKTLTQQYEKTVFIDSNSSVCQNNIIKLLDKKSYVITTGHQINICLSPLFLIYKIVTVIAYSIYLNKKIPNYRCIPCFWMATEDHDFEEVNTFNLYTKTYTWDHLHQDAVGNLSTKSINPLLLRIKKEFEQTSNGQELYKIFYDCYSKNNNYANATRSLLTKLFGDYGLVTVDGNAVNLKRLFIHTMKAEIKSNIVFNSISTSNKLISKKYKPQINALKSNIFYLFNSKRSKIELKNNDFFSNGHKKKWSKVELLEEIETYPERFSPNVFLRTLYQQTILPNILYIGGPSEISYWLQLKQLFEKQKVCFPLLTLRSSFLILPKKLGAFYKRNNLKKTDVFLSYDYKVRKMMNKDLEFNRDVLLDNINIYFSNIREEVEKLDGFPVASFDVFQTRSQKELLKLESKLLKFKKNQNRDLLNQLMKMEEKVFFNNIIQERNKSFIFYYMKYGVSFFQFLIKESVIFDDKYIILDEKE